MNASAQWLEQLAGPSVADVRTATLVLLLLLAAAIDVRTMRIPNWLTLCGALMGLALGAAMQWQLLGPGWALDGLLWSLAGLGAGFALMLPLYALRVMGAGDVKLMAMVGAFLGLSQLVPAVVIVFITGGVVALAVALATRQLTRLAGNVRDIVQGMALSALVAQRLPGMSPGASIGKLPYGVSISAGTLLYLAARQLGYL